MLYMLYTLSSGKLMYVSELDGYPRSESICVCVPDAWSFASAENVQYSNSVVWRREKLVRRPPRARYKMYLIGFDLMLRVYIDRSECFCTQDAYVGVCAQVESVHRSSGPPKHSTKGKFLINCSFFFARQVLVRQWLQFDLIIVCLSRAWAIFARIWFYGSVWW